MIIFWKRNPVKLIWSKNFTKFIEETLVNSVIHVGFHLIFHIYICTLNNEHVRIFWINLLNDVLINSYFGPEKQVRQHPKENFVLAELLYNSVIHVYLTYYEIHDTLWLLNFSGTPLNVPMSRLICDSCNSWCEGQWN